LPLKLRFRYGFVDTEGTAAAPVDAVQARAYYGPTPLANLGSPVGGAHRGKVWSEWVTADAGTHIQFDFTADGKNCAPGVSCFQDGGFTADAGWPYSGVMLEGYEVTRMQAGAKPYRTSLGFPGQKYDDETDVYENWNRYYDWKSGRYLSPEPLLQEPGFVGAVAQRGMSTATYSYAANNPVRFTDRDGRCIFFAVDTAVCLIGAGDLVLITAAAIGITAAGATIAANPPTFHTTSRQGSAPMAAPIGQCDARPAPVPNPRPPEDWGGCLAAYLASLARCEAHGIRPLLCEANAFRGFAQCMARVGNPLD